MWFLPSWLFLTIYFPLLIKKEVKNKIFGWLLKVASRILHIYFSTVALIPFYFILKINVIRIGFGLKRFFVVQDTHNQAGIAHSGGLVPLLKLLDSRNGSLQHNAAFALYGLADNEVYFDEYTRIFDVAWLVWIKAFSLDLRLYL